MFVFILVLIDLFSNIIRYINNEVPVSAMLKIGLYYVPKCISYAIPMSLLFAAAYTLGDLYSKNELTTVFSSGIPFWRFSFSLVIIGLAASVFIFFLDDIIVIPTLKVKNELTRRALRQFTAGSNVDIVIKTRNGRLIYSVDYYDDELKILNGITIIEMDENGEFVSQIRANSAFWLDDYWEFRNASIYKYDEDRILRISPLGINTSYTEHPDMFMRSALIMDELPVKQVRLLVDDLRISGLPHYSALANYYRRFSFSTTSLIVMLLSIPLGGRFRKNILLMSLFASLSVAVVYYIAEMLSMTMAGLNYISPLAGAWFPVVLFILIGIILLRSAKT
jgi:lipopolysaccharide export system permease protein